MRWAFLFVIFILPAIGHSFDFKSSKVFVSIESTGQGRHWHQSICDSIHAGLNSVQQTHVVCAKSYGQFNDPIVNEVRKAKTYDYHISLKHIEFPNILVSIQNWNAHSDVDFKYVSYKVDFTDTEKLQQVLYRLTRNLNNYDTKKEGLIRVLDKVYEADLTSYKGETYSNKIQFKKIIIEAGAALGFGAFWYYSDDNNENDWDIDTGIIDSLKEKALGNSVRYDDNSKYLNVGHAFAGMLYHQVGRANGMSQRQAFITSFVLSATWEGLVEYREILSINDMVHTGLSGPVIGEVFFQMARSLRNRDSVIAKALSVVLDGPSGVNTWLNRNKNIPKSDASFEDEFNFSLGWKEMGLEGEVMALPDGEKVSAFLPQGFYTKLKVNAELGDGLSLDEYQLLTKIAFMGYTKRNRKKNPDGSYTGYEFIVSAASEFDWQDRNGDGGDFLVHARVLGTSVMLNTVYKGTEIQLNYDFYGDFAMLRSYALNSYLEEDGNNLAGFPGVVQKEQYYFGLGTTHRGGISMARGRFSLGADYEMNNIKATNSKDRYQEMVTKAFKARDKHSILELWLKMNITERLSAKVAYEKVKRSGTLYAYKVANTENRVRGTLTYKF